MKFPSTVPAWLRAEVDLFAADIVCARFLEAVASTKTVNVWPTLQKRATAERPASRSLLLLAVAIEEAIRGAGEHRLSKMQRKRRASRIAKLALALYSEIETHPEFYSLGLQSMNAGLGEYVIADSWLQETSDRLKKIARVAETWGQQEQMLPRPNDQNAARLYFLRNLTQFFQREYGQPLREQTIALASVFFDCDDITTADLSRLAPV